MAITYESKSQLMTLRQLAQVERYRLVFTENKLRSLIAAGSPRLSARGNIIPGNGIFEAGAVIRIGKRIFIDPVAFERWLTAGLQVPCRARAVSLRPSYRR